MSEAITNIDDEFPSRFFKVADLNGESVVYEISHAQRETVGGAAEEKPVLYFTEEKRGLVLNKTNANTLKELSGPIPAEWEVDHRGGECFPGLLHRL